ncbi:EAL domain-containing protein [Vibrio gangliei]|uniref:EAL domain-containing protein n=1 Tax=Vibrio gangliei TaxID=2077090 RepID=UPI000D01A9BE|nr:EAL domain-containing protein [Vibrio gangliei]
MNSLFLRCCAITLLVFFTLFLLLNFLVSSIQKEQQESLATELLLQAETISGQVVQALDDAQTMSIESCDKASMDNLRAIVSHYEYVYDLGILLNNKVACSANWGTLLEPPSLPEEHYVTPAGVLLQSQVMHVLPVDFILNTARKDHYVVFSSPMLFKVFSTRMLGFSFRIETQNTGLTYYSYTPQDRKPLNLSIFHQSTVLCSEKYTYCIHTLNQRAGLFYYKPAVWMSILLLAFISSVLLAYAYKSIQDKKRSMELRFKKAIAGKRLTMEYQPVVEAKSGKIINFESLVRWCDDVYGKVSPELFLGMAETLSLYPKVAHQIVEKVMKDIGPVLQRYPDLGVTLNVTSYEIQHHSFLMHLSNLATKHSITPSQIKIEITEKIDVSLEDLSRFSKEAKRMGFVVVLDDFGTGVANLVWLTEIDFDVIKVDRVFTQALTNDFKNKMVLPILGLINDLQKEVVFEGVEVKEELDMILEINPNAYVQGWYFYKSLPIKDLKVLLKNEYQNL